MPAARGTKIKKITKKPDLVCVSVNGVRRDLLRKFEQKLARRAASLGLPAPAASTYLREFLEKQAGAR